MKLAVSLSTMRKMVSDMLFKGVFEQSVKLILFILQSLSKKLHL